MLWGDGGLAGVVLCGMWRRWGIFSWDSILRWRRVLGRGVGLGHRFRRSRGVLIALWVEKAKRWLEPLSLQSLQGMRLFHFRLCGFHTLLSMASPRSSLRRDPSSEPQEGPG